jgi:multidrug transporter EmrE-like cation transporter
MAAVAGVLLFQEAFSKELVLGVLLTIAGLILMKR